MTEQKRRFKLRLREPFSGLSHLAGALLGVAALVVLVAIGHDSPWKVTSFAIYGASLIVLYSASAAYHLIPAGPVALERLRRFDHAGIFALIAGSYTPLCLIKLRGGWGWSLCGIVWGMAGIGIVLEIVWQNMPEWVDLSLYLIMGWLAILAIEPITHAIGAAAVHWLVTGGVLYTVGSIIFATERPRLWPGVFGAHDLWHLFVLAGSMAHFMLMLSLAHPIPS